MLRIAGPGNPLNQHHIDHFPVDRVRHRPGGEHEEEERWQRIERHAIGMRQIGAASQCEDAGDRQPRDDCQSHRGIFEQFAE